MRSAVGTTLGSSIAGAALVALALLLAGQGGSSLVGYGYWLMLLMVAFGARSVSGAVMSGGVSEDQEGALWPVAVVEGVVLPLTWSAVGLFLPTGSAAADIVVHVAVLTASWGSCLDARQRTSTPELAQLRTLDLHRLPLPVLAAVDLWIGTMLSFCLAIGILFVLIGLNWRRASVPKSTDRPSVGPDDVTKSSPGEWGDQPKARFFAMAAHDLQQPLQGMRLAIQAYQHSSDERSAAELVTVLEESVKSMSALADEILEVARADKLLGAPQYARVAVSELASELELIHRPVAQSKGLRLVVEVASGYVYTDKVLLKRAIGNLISNAIRYTTVGAVVVRGSSEGGVFRLDVMDTGPGIEREERARVFEDYYQSPTVRQSDASSAGYGLGLSIVRRICADLGVEVRLESELCVGTCVRLCMPVAGDAPSKRDAKAATLLLAMSAGAERTRVEGMLSSWGVAAQPVSVTAIQAELQRCLDAGNRTIAVMDAECWSELESHSINVFRSERWLASEGVLLILARKPADVDCANSRRALATVLTTPVKPIQLRACLNHHLAV